MDYFVGYLYKSRGKINYGNGIISGVDEFNLKVVSDFEEGCKEHLRKEGYKVDEKSLVVITVSEVK